MVGDYKAFIEFLSPAASSVTRGRYDSVHVQDNAPAGNCVIERSLLRLV